MGLKYQSCRGIADEAASRGFGGGATGCELTGHLLVAPPDLNPKALVAEQRALGTDCSASSRVPRLETVRR